MEGLLRQIAEQGLVEPRWHRLLDAVRAREILLPDLLKASNQNRLDELLRSAQDETLRAAVDKFLKTDPNYVTRQGLGLLLRMAESEFGKDPRFSILRQGKNITLMCARAKREGGTRGDGTLSHNTVHRTLLLSASKLVRFHLGNAKRGEIFAEVDFSREDDSRDVWLNPEELARLLACCEPWFRPFVLAAASTGADRQPLLRLTVRDVRIEHDEAADRYTGAIYLRDSKTDSRPRTVAIVDPVCRALLPLLKGKSADTQVFDGPPDPAVSRRKPLTAHQIRYWFEKAREAASLEYVRFKDLRHTWAVNADRAGLSLGKMQAGMGHRLDETTLRYTKRQVKLETRDAEKVAREMGLL